MKVDLFLNHITSSRDYRGQIAWREHLEASEASFATPARALPEALARALANDGIEQLYTHQAAALDATAEGKHVAVVTSTASGKTLTYNLPVLATMLEDPRARALYLFPTKALAQDQLRVLERIIGQVEGLDLDTGTYDGDTAQARRTALRDSGRIILSNPDMLHSGIMPHHSRWSHFFANLRYVVLDEIHTYRGIFGSNVANVLRRLQRICRHYGADPQFILCSATIGNPGEHAEKLLGLPVTVVDNNGAPRGPRTFILWNPPFIDDPPRTRRSYNVEARSLMTSLIADANAQTIAFVRSRLGAELLFRYTREALAQISVRLSESIRPYRGGYLASERREIEQLLFSQQLMGVTSTNALELGIDVGSLDAALIVGYPGSIASTWQEAGRAGRGFEESLAILIARETPLDQYLMRHPEYFFGQNPERAVIDPENPFVLYRHLRCALQELPVTAADEELFGPFMGGVLEVLGEEGQTRQIRDRWYWSGPAAPAREVSLRNSDENNYVIQNADTGAVIGEIDVWGAYTMLHTEAIYMHEGETFFSEKLDLQEKVAYVRPGEFDYYTMAESDTMVRVLDLPDDPAIDKTWRVSEVGFGPVEVTSLVHMFRKTKFQSLDSLGWGGLDLPPVLLDTVACWVTPPPTALARVRQYGRDPYEGLLGVSNAVRGVLPLHVLCEPADVGTAVDSSNFGVPTLFVYDKYSGGMGFARKYYDLTEDVLREALRLVEECPCGTGCPSCVGSPEPPGTIEEPGPSRPLPDREAALCLLHDLLELEPYVPPPGDKLPAPTAEEMIPLQAASHVPARPVEIRRLPEHIAGKIRAQLREAQTKLKAKGRPQAGGKSKRGED
ncbi:MAG TPA: DEAD/DEAH box helicase [Armatimonadota bacterium]|jgi:DEAD/DEAH box helicase domain-containing protein